MIVNRIKISAFWAQFNIESKYLCGPYNDLQIWGSSPEGY